LDFALPKITQLNQSPLVMLSSLYNSGRFKSN